MLSTPGQTAYPQDCRDAQSNPLYYAPDPGPVRAGEESRAITHHCCDNLRRTRRAKERGGNVLMVRDRSRIETQSGRRKPRRISEEDAHKDVPCEFVEEMKVIIYED